MIVKKWLNAAMGPKLAERLGYSRREKLSGPKDIFPFPSLEYTIALKRNPMTIGGFAQPLRKIRLLGFL